MHCSTQGLPVHHQLLEFTQTHVHWVSDTIQPPHPLLSPSPPDFNLSQHQGLFKWVSSSHQVAKSIGASASTSVLPVNTQDWSPLGWTGWISLQSRGLSRVFANITVEKHQFFSAQLYSQSNSHIQSSLQVYNKTSKTVGLESNLYKGLCIIFFLWLSSFPPTGNHSKTNLFELNLALLF